MNQYALVISNHFELKTHAKNGPNTPVTVRGVPRVNLCVPLMVMFYADWDVYPV